MSEPLHRPHRSNQEANGESMVPVHRRLARAWDRNYNLRGLQFVAWNAGTFTIPADDPMAVELWENRELNHQITVISTSEVAWWIDRMDRTTDGLLVVSCRPHVDVLRKCIIPDWKLVEDWLEAERRWKSEQATEWHVQDVGTVKISEHGGVAFSTCCPNHWLVCTAQEARQFAKALKKAAGTSAKLRGER